MKATPQMQLRLLDLQELDTRVSALTHRARALPELIDLARLEKERQPLEDQVVRTETAVGDIRREVARAEAAVQQVRDRAARDQARLDSGSGSAKELQSLQHELESLARRQGVLEDEELEVMERAETAQAEVDAAVAARDEVVARLEELRSAADEKTALIDAEKAEVAAGRDAIVADLDAPLVALYERIRTQSGTGAAALMQRRCGGCRLELNAADLSRIRSAAADDVVRCEECGRIMVRTEESGL